MSHMIKTPPTNKIWLTWQCQQNPTVPNVLKFLGKKPDSNWLTQLKEKAAETTLLPHEANTHGYFKKPEHRRKLKAIRFQEVY